MNGTKRCRILFGLEAGDSTRAIAKAVSVSLTTVSREISKHTYESFKGGYIGRTCADYQKFLADHPGVDPAYTDLVIGRPGGVCLLTLHWLKAEFVVGILIPNKCAANVTAAKLHIAKIDPKRRSSSPSSSALK